MQFVGSKKFRSIAGMMVTLGLVCAALAFAQAPPAQGQGRGGRGGAAAAGAPAAGGGRGGAAVERASTAPLLFKVEFVRPANQTGQTAVVQENVADPNVEVKWYGPAAKKLLTTGNL